jgi:hypothetical protein
MTVKAGEVKPVRLVYDGPAHFIYLLGFCPAQKYELCPKRFERVGFIFLRNPTATSLKLFHRDMFGLLG